jgi:hypothetical protein
MNHEDHLKREADISDAYGKLHQRIDLATQALTAEKTKSTPDAQVLDNLESDLKILHATSFY